jgi:Domain of unknown function (DUF4382)
MASTILLIGIVALAIILALAYFAFSGISAAGLANVAVQITDPPNVPQGTQNLLVSYSSVEVHVSGESNQSGWVSATGSGTVDLLALTNISETIANAKVAANSTINLVRFNITSVEITINNKTYNVTSPNNQITVAVTGTQKINSSSAVLIDFYPTINGHVQGNTNSTAYVMAPAARAVVVNSNSTIKINANVGSTATINDAIKAKLGIGLGIGIGGGSGSSSNASNNGTYGASIVVSGGNRVSNFLVQRIDYNSSTVSGLLYVQYPLATNVGENTTLHINDNVGYACDNTEFRLTSIYANGSAVFTHILTTSTVGGCPI